MENNELLRRGEDLRTRCERKAAITMTGFLTPAEGYQLENWSKHTQDCDMVLCGGREQCERTVAFFIPYYMDKSELDVSEYICAIKLTSRFGTPGHRDYMGAVLGMGVKREWVGDIWVMENTAYIFCLPSVLKHLLSIDKVGRFGVKTESIELQDIPEPERQVKKVSFSVMSLRLDAVVGGMFNLSRTEAAKQITAGNVSLNYTECIRTDAAVHEGDIISLRRSGKGSITATGGTSRKGRLFVYAEIYK